MQKEKTQPMYQIDVQIKADFAAPLANDWITRIVGSVLRKEGQPESAGIAIVITDDTQMRELHRSFRDVDLTTDVLSFPASGGPEFVTPEEEGLYLGDVVVSYPMALVQAAEQGHSVEDELALLIVHGCLHLLGYDDTTEKERQVMWRRQEEILRDQGS